MRFLHPGTFDFGLLLGCIAFASLTLSVLFCFLFRIHIREVLFFSMPTYSFRRFNIDFKLGWVPGAMAVVPFGMTAQKKEQEQFASADLPYAFFTKKPIQKILICYNGTVTLLLGVTFLYILFKPVNDASFFSNLLLYIKEAFKTPFSDDTQKTAFSGLTHTMAARYNFFSFALLCYLIVLVFHEAIINTANYLNNAFAETRLLSLFRKILFNVPSLFIAGWSIVLIATYNGGWGTFFYILNGLAGYYVSAVLLFFVNMLFVKTIGIVPKYQLTARQTPEETA